MTTRRGRRTVSIEPKEPKATLLPQEPEDKVESNKADLNPVEESSNVEATTKSFLTDATGRPKEEKYRERIIERIIILPGGQCTPRPYQRNFQPPPPRALSCEENCCDGERKEKRKKRKSSKKHEFAADNYSLEERPIYPPPRPKVSCLPPQPCPPPVIIYKQPVMCCKHHCEDDSEDSDQEDDTQSVDTATFMSFANMVFAAANVMSGFPDAYN